MNRFFSILIIAVASASPVLAKDKDRVELEGYAEWRSGELLIVDGQRVLPTSGMKLEGDKRVRSFASIPVGYEVKVKGRRASDGRVLAEKVEVKPNGLAWLERDLVVAFDEVEAAWRRAGHVYEETENEEPEGEDGGLESSLGELLESGPEVERAGRIARKLLPPYVDRETFRVYVVDNEEWNAMAGPNGAIFVYRGLLEALDDDEVAIVLGHEIAHVTHEHSRRAYKKSFFIELATLTGLAVVDGAVESRTTREMAGLGAMLGTLAWTNGYGRKQEDQADRVGLRYAYEAGFDVSKGPELWRKFAGKYGDANRVLRFFFSDHSASLVRAENLELELARNYRDR